jgi:uncharacterized protein (TIRG00374 family)
LNQAATTRDTSSPTTLPLRKRLIYALKLIVTTALIGIIIWHVDLREFLDAVRRMDWRYVLASLLLLFTGVVVSAFKWQRLLMVHRVRFTFARLLKWYLVGAFIGSFLPSTIGGDSYRIFKSMSNPRSKASAVLAVFVERISGLIALVIIGYVAAISVYLRDKHTLAYGFAALGTVALACGVLTLAAAMYGKLGRRLLAMKIVPDAVKSFIDHAGEYKSQPNQIALTMLLSFLFHSIRIMSAWIILMGFGVQMRIDQIALVGTITPMIAMIPVSLNGLGLQEGSMLFLLQQFGVSSAIALAVPLIIRVNMTSISLMGGVIYFFDSGKDNTAVWSGQSVKQVKEEQQAAMQQLRSGHHAEPGVEE